MELVFEYDESMTFEDNFVVWYDMNCRERSAWNEKVYTKEEGMKVFKEMYAVEVTN
tara:strand:+ start:347 stop:514 length:168 start_codon:yes stop_codon:yes gene_type:complete